MSIPNDALSRPPAPTPPSYRWVILALSASAFIMAFLSRFAWPPLMPAVMPVMEISRTQGLAYMSAFYIGYIITQIPGGVMADRFGPRLVLSAALLLQGLGTLGLGLTGNYQTGFILRVICGLGGGCVYSSSLKAVVAWFSPAGRGLAIAILMSAPTVGVALPNFILPGLEASFGWQASFQIVGAAVMAVAVLILIFMKNGAAMNNGPRKSFAVGLKYVFGNRDLILLALIGFGGLWVQIGFGSVGNDYLVSAFGVSLKGAGQVMVFYGLAGLAASLGAGFLAGRFPAHKKRMLISCHLLMAVFCLIFGCFNSVTTALAGACLIGMTISFGNPMYAIMTADRTPPEWMATAGGVTSTIFQLGALISPLVLGKVIDLSGTFTFTWWILAGGALSGAVLAVFLSGGRPKSD